MKKAILITAALGVSFSGIAQDKYVVSANIAFNAAHFDEAKENIDKAMSSPETKEKPKALFAKAQIYKALQGVDKYKATNPYREGAQALEKLTEVKADFDKSKVDELLMQFAVMYFNDGLRANNDKKFAEAAEDMKNVVKIHDLNGGKRFEKSPAGPKFDTISATANNVAAITTYYAEQYDQAIPMLIASKNNPITRTPSVYETLADAYGKQKNSAEEIATINEARKYFPEDVTIRNQELNYYISTGKQDEVLRKLEEAAAKEPDNADIQFNLGTTYLGLAMPKDNKKPANEADLLAKSEAAYGRAVAKDPNNAGFNYNFGSLYYNQATEVNEQMNAVTGTSAADNKKYKELETKRNELFAKSTPYFEKAYTVLGAKAGELKGEDFKTYRNTLVALQEVYARQSKLDKSAEMKKKLDGLK